MKIWRLNRTQHAKPFFQDGRMRLGFLTGSYLNVEDWEDLQGNQVTLHRSGHAGGQEIKIRETESAIIREWPDGKTEYMAKMKL